MKVADKKPPKFIDKTHQTDQETFSQNRHILDEVLVVSGLIDSRKRSKNPRLIFKIDIEKAYDYVEYMMEEFAFGIKWRAWIKKCISSTSFSVFVNESPSLLCKACWGLRQGDPLSPFFHNVGGSFKHPSS